MASQRSTSRTRSGGDEKPRSAGLAIAPRFAITTTLALGVLLIGFAFVLLDATKGIVDTAVKESRDQSAAALMQHDRGELGYETTSTKAVRIREDLLRFPVEFTAGEREGEEGFAYVVPAEANKLALLVPERYDSGHPAKKLYALFITMTALVLIVAAGVATAVASRVSQPIKTLVDDVRSIANGNLAHRVRARGGGEVGQLASAMDRMVDSLREARDAEVELGVREREREVALEVQEALRSTAVGAPDGYDVASEHVGSAEPGGDFHAVVQADDGAVVYFVCDVSGTGVPGALVGAMARAYLRSAFKEGGELSETLKKVNRTLAGEVRRGMYVTVLAARLDPATHELEVASAGHKLPLVHWSAAEKAIRAIQPDGIALGFDKGPVFDRGLSTRRVPMDPGDRILLAGTGAVRVVDHQGDEIGEKRLYKLFARNAPDVAEEALDGLLTALEAYADEEPFPVDVSVVVLGRIGSA